MMDVLLKHAHFWVRKLYRRTIQLFGSHLYFNPGRDLQKRFMVAGAARSGTVWLADMIGSQIPCRFMFEPFNPNLVQEYREFNYFQYMRAGTDNEKLYKFAYHVLSGDIRNAWIDHQNEHIFPKYRLIKDIRA